MKPGGPLKRTARLTAKVGLRRTTELQARAFRESLSARQPTGRSAIAKGKSAPGKVQRDVGPTPEVVEACLDRDSYSCALCGMGVGPEARGIGWSLHHRLLRSQGVQHTVQNLIVLCGSGTTDCHGWVHGNPADARKGGWMLSGRQEPLAVPVLIAGQRWVYLTSTGLYHDVREDVA